MKIALSANGKTLEDELDSRFGRALGFIIYDTESKNYNFVDNSLNMDASKGAGIQAGQNVVDNNADIVITGYCGPKAYKVLACANIKVYNAKKAKIKDVIEQFLNNELSIQEEDED